ncbi:hypothetical protein [Streptomyces sp. NPDC039016]|uniref:hypothetical protein n=1 Tax=Streptomyces sp. NPDC039016 TaxID=3154330 RepID=UPI0033EB2BC2
MVVGGYRAAFGLSTVAALWICLTGDATTLPRWLPRALPAPVVAAFATAHFTYNSLTAGYLPPATGPLLDTTALAGAALSLCAEVRKLPGRPKHQSGTSHQAG